MTWTPNPVLRRAAEIVADLMEAAEFCYGKGWRDTSPTSIILLEHRMVDLITDVLFKERLAGSEEAARLEKAKEQHFEMRRRLDEQNAEQDRLHRDGNGETTWRDHIHEQRPGSDVNNAADIAAHQLESGELAWPDRYPPYTEAEVARQRLVMETNPVVIPLRGEVPGTIIEHNGVPYRVREDGKAVPAYPPAKDNLQEQVGTTQADSVFDPHGILDKERRTVVEIEVIDGVAYPKRHILTPYEYAARQAKAKDPRHLSDAELDAELYNKLAEVSAYPQEAKEAVAGTTTLETLAKEGFAHTITMTDGPEPGGIIETHVGTTATIVEPLGNGPAASVDAETPVAQASPPAKKKGRPKGSLGKKKKDALKKAKAAERAAAKAAKEAEKPAPAEIEVKDFVEAVTVHEAGPPEHGLGSEAWKQADIDETEFGGGAGRGEQS